MDFVDTMNQAYSYNKSLLQPITKDTYIIGYFQNPLYFEDIRELLLNDFSLRNEPTPQCKTYEKEKLKSKMPVSIYIRRGDYVQHKMIFNLLSKDYYESAVNMVQQYAPDCTFYVFSDDTQYAQSIFHGSNFRFITGTPKGYEYEEIFLMSLCKHNIIANSSFSWWGAWLNKNEQKKVIVPKQWLSNKNNVVKICPQDWILL